MTGIVFLIITQGGSSLRKRTMLSLVLAAVVAILYGLLNIYQAGWQLQSTTAHNNPELGPNWSRVWLLPLRSGYDQASQQLARELQQSLSGLGLQVELAPAAYQLAAGENPPIVLEYEIGDWSIAWGPFRRTAMARVTFKSSLFGELNTGNTLSLEGSCGAVGRYRGLIKHSRVNAEMLGQVAGSITKQLANSLGLTVPAPSEQNGFHWSFSLRLSDRWQQLFPSPSSVSHALVLKAADYSWQFPLGEQMQQVYLYRTTQRGDELERELLDRLPIDYAGDRSFTDIDYNGCFRRRLGMGLVSHWSAVNEARFGTQDPLTGSFWDHPLPYSDLQQQVMERYVLVIDPPALSTPLSPAPDDNSAAFPPR